MRDVSTRDYFGLTQERLASWLGIDRTQLAHLESGRRGLPLAAIQQSIRLDWARLGRVPDGAGGSVPAPPLPVPPIEPSLLAPRFDYCQHHARRLRRELAALRDRAAPYEARLAALPALRAGTGSGARPAHEENWLALFASEAEEALLFTCGAGPQRLLEARLAGLEHEAALLREILGSDVTQ
ncbi:hypothetical protein A0257_08845 [Hymenobacter psoromatis]|nr:hypothetical protein A0257_08845 [Hymenobacter psoromatis]